MAERLSSDEEREPQTRRLSPQTVEGRPVGEIGGSVSPQKAADRPVGIVGGLASSQTALETLVALGATFVAVAAVFRHHEGVSHYGPYAYELYRKALEDGSEEDCSIRVNVVGNFGQGKTSLVRRLVRESIDGVKSTNGIDILRYRCKLDASGYMIHTENQGLDLTDIAQRIKSVALKEKEKCIDSGVLHRRRPKDMSIEERDKLLDLVKHPTEQQQCSDDNTKAFDIWDFGGHP